MDANYIINYIKNAKKKTPVKVYLNAKEEIRFPKAKVFGSNNFYVILDKGEFFLHCDNFACGFCCVMQNRNHCI